jgi:hypothetical protein
MRLGLHFYFADPKLPTHVYGKVLRGQLFEIEKMLAPVANDALAESSPSVVRQTQVYFLDTLMAWGSTTALKELIKFYKQFETLGQENGTSNSLVECALSKAEDALHRRYTQTAAGYLHLAAATSLQKRPHFQKEFNDNPMDSLFDVDDLFGVMAPRAPIIFERETKDVDDDAVPTELINTQFALEALGRLSIMQGKYDNALKCFLAIGTLYCTPSLSTLEDQAILEVNNTNPNSSTPIPQFAFVLAMIESKQLHQCLLNPHFVSESVQDNSYQTLLCLFQLVGLDLMGRFLLEHCVAPSNNSSPMSSQSDSTENDTERHETLPVDLVADQLSSKPKLLHWYLHLLLTSKPEVYTKFPNTAYPPKAITDLHRTHLDLFIQYAGREKDSVNALDGMEPYKMDHKNTPLLSFLKVS